MHNGHICLLHGCHFTPSPAPEICLISTEPTCFLLSLLFCFIHYLYLVSLI